ncbi:MAG TPA: divalent-cation tolerance protein CutA [Azoarcus sp.]|nr:divalent-cation tolerance protein CutA [Azoarcus sp.]
MSETLLVLTNAPDPETADAIARCLVDQRLAACVNVLAPCRSVYRWENKIEDATEIPLWIKTTSTRYAEVARTITRHHPFDTPEILAFPVSCGLPAYLDWVAQETSGN